MSAVSSGPTNYVEYGELVQPDAILVARAVVDRRGGGDEVNLIVNELIPLDQLDSRYTTGVLIRIDEEQHGSGRPERAARNHDVLSGRL